MHTTEKEHMRKPIAYLDVANRSVHLCKDVVFHTPTVAEIDQQALYLAQDWVGLTDEERETLRSDADEADAGYRKLIKATEAKLKEKNT